MTTENGISDASVADFGVPPPKSEQAARADRLKSAIQRAGGGKRVQELSGVPSTTLHSYLKGGEMKLSSAVALAAACGVSVEWLATGQQPSATAAAATDRAAPTAPPPLFSIVDMELLTEAISVANKIFEARGATEIGLNYARLICLLYDEARNRMNNPNTPA